MEARAAEHVHISKRPSENDVCSRAAKHPVFGSLRRVLDFHVVYRKVKKGPEFVKITLYELGAMMTLRAIQSPDPRRTTLGRHTIARMVERVIAL